MYNGKSTTAPVNTFSAYTKEELRSMLPQIGERRIENGVGSNVIQLTSRKPGLCTVVVCTIHRVGKFRF